jgi:hypothetical protein
MTASGRLPDRRVSRGGLIFAPSTSRTPLPQPRSGGSLLPRGDCCIAGPSPYPSLVRGHWPARRSARVDGLEPTKNETHGRTAGHLSESDRAARCPTGKARHGIEPAGPDGCWLSMLPPACPQSRGVNRITLGDLLFWLGSNEKNRRLPDSFTPRAAIPIESIACTRPEVLGSGSLSKRNRAPLYMMIGESRSIWENSIPPVDATRIPSRSAPWPERKQVPPGRYAGSDGARC